MINLREARYGDRAMLGQWRNDALTRAMSRTRTEVSWADHCAWFDGVLDDPSRHLLIGERDGQAVGTVRLDRGSDRAEIHITVAPEARGQGAGLALLLAAEAYAKILDLDALTAVIRPSNPASKVIFVRAGYTRCGQDDQVEHYRRDLR
jgi:UDP-2,4-diacetamido-2,4,6-trideoxy-beta-L-altropyranose hydrolase